MLFSMLVEMEESMQHYIFGCLGFNTNPVFLMVNEYPQPVGFVRENYNETFEFCPDSFNSPKVSLDANEIIETYIAQFKKHGVVINDVSKEAWLEGNFGELDKNLDIPLNI